MKKTNLIIDYAKPYIILQIYRDRSVNSYVHTLGTDLKFKYIRRLISGQFSYENHPNHNT